MRPWVFVGWCPYVTRFIFVICMFYGRPRFGTLTSMEISPCYPQKRAHRFQMVEWVGLVGATTRPSFTWEINANLR